MDLTKEEAKSEQLHSLLRAELPSDLVDYLLVGGSHWGASLAGDIMQQPPVPSVFLAGAPLIVAGSNGKVAWGFINSYGDWVDLIQLEYADVDRNTYKTPYRPQAFTRRQVLVRDSDGGEHASEQLESLYGPILKQGLEGNPLAVRWTQCYPQAANLNLLQLEQAGNVNEAVNIANISGVPSQNMMVADVDGNIAWAIAGIMPVRNCVSNKLVPWQLAGIDFPSWLAP